MIRRGLFLPSLASQASASSPCPACLGTAFPWEQGFQRELHTGTNSLSKLKLRETPPPGWRHGPDPKANRSTYNRELSEYKEKVAVLRNAWRTRIAQHNQVLAKRKAERDAARLNQQREDLRRQLARWVAPDVMRGLQSELDGVGSQQQGAGAAAAGGEAELSERQREKAARVEAERAEARQRRHDRMAERYSRQAMTMHLAQVSRAAQAELLLRESGQWVTEAEVDAAIQHALDNPVDLFASAEPWSRGLEGVPEYVQGFEGPQAEQGLPEHVVRRMRRNN